MPELRVLIADDEPLARQGIRQLLERERDVVTVGEARDGRETLRAIRQLRPNVVFLDVQMPDMDGLAVVRTQGVDRMPHTVFVTAYDTFAVRAFDAHAVDYLVKPLNESRFAEAVERLRHQIVSTEAIQLSRKFSELLGSTVAGQTQNGLQAITGGARRLIVSTAGGDLLLDASEIDWIEADDYYAAIHSGGRRHLIREALASLELRLDATQFIRVHRSAIVNVNYVRELRSAPGGDTVVVLRDGTRLPVSRRRRQSVTDLIRSSSR